jgi:hypothetical protein
MNLQQMIESAILDAMGLLDDSEREQFERAFRTASPVIQAQIRREQTRLSQIEALLPDVTPPASLRAAVVDAVRRQIEAGQTASGQFVAPELLRSNPSFALVADRHLGHGRGLGGAGLCDDPVRIQRTGSELADEER